MNQPKPEVSKKRAIKEQTDPSTKGQVFSDPDDRTGNEQRPNQAQTDLKEAKQVMDDEGGANQANMKQQQVKEAEKKAEQAKKADEPEQACSCG